MFPRNFKTLILDLHKSFGRQIRSEYQQEHNCENTEVKQDRIDALKLIKYIFQVKKGPKNNFFPIF